MKDNTDANAAFESAYQLMLQHHVKSSKGERKRRLAKGLGFAEKKFLSLVWYPAFGQFDGLYPEYEVRDFKDGARFIDFAYMKNNWKVCLEIDPFGTHYRDVDRWKYSDNLIRHNDLVIDNWKVLRFSLDSITGQPRQCQRQIQQAFGKWGIGDKPVLHANNPIHRALLNLMAEQEPGISPAEGSRLLGWRPGTIAKHMKQLFHQGYLLPVNPGGKRYRRYRLNPDYLRNMGELQHSPHKTQPKPAQNSRPRTAGI